MNEISKNSRHFFIKLIAAAAAIMIVLGVVSFPLKTVSYTVYSDKVSKPFRLVQISDLHGCKYGKNMTELISAVDIAEPDAVVMTGDIYDDISDNKNTSVLLKDLASKYDCYYVAGNHEFKNDKWQKINKPEAVSFGVNVLEGDNVKTGEITICGASRPADCSISFDDAVEKCAENTSGFSVLLCHYPEKIDYCRSFESFDLILCGHAHGGQWRIPGLLNGLYAPGQGIFPKYAGGRYDFDDCTMIVSRGLCRIKNIVPRIFNNPELVVIDIMPEK